MNINNMDININLEKGEFCLFILFSPITLHSGKNVKYSKFK